MMSVPTDPRPTHRSALKSCYPCNESRTGPESRGAWTVGWNRKSFLCPVTQGNERANVCCLDLVSTVPGVNLASGHSTRHAHHFPPAKHIPSVETKAAWSLERGSLMAQKTLSLSGILRPEWWAPDTLSGQGDPICCLRSAGPAEGVGWGLGFLFKVALLGHVDNKMK